MSHIKKFFLLALCLLFAAIAPAGAETSIPDNEAEPNPWHDRSFLILATTKEYATALKTAQEAAKALQIQLDLRGLSEYKNPETQKPDLTFSQTECEDNGWSVPCYVPRARWDDTVFFVSIELTDGYKGLTPGYYFVTAGITNPGDIGLQELLTKAKIHFKDAYIKTGQVYMGCLH